MRASAAAPHLAELARFILPKMAHGVLASSTIKGAGERAGCRVTCLEEAVTHRWMSYNDRRVQTAEGLDYDATDFREKLAIAVSRGLKPPNFIVWSPWKGTCHPVWVYRTPVSLRDARQVRLRRGIRRGLLAVFGGDPHFSNRLTKNPFALTGTGKLIEPDAGTACGVPEIWEAYQRLGEPTTYYTEVLSWQPADAVPDLFRPLLEFAKEHGLRLVPPEPIDPTSETARKQQVARFIATKGHPAEKGSRLYRALGDWARHHRKGDEGVILAAGKQLAVSLGSPAEPAAIETLARRVARWMRENWWGPLSDDPTKVPDPRWVERRPIDRGVMRGEAADRGPQALAEWDSLFKAEKQGEAGLRSARVNSADTDSRIIEGVRKAMAEGGKLTARRVATLADVSLATVERRWKSLRVATDGMNENPSNASLIRPGASLPGALPLSFQKESSSSSSSSSSSPTLAELARSTRPVRVPTAERRRLAAEFFAAEEAARKAAEAVAAAERRIVEAYEELARRMSCRGADPETVPSVPSNASSSVEAAHRAALAAKVSAERRAYGRKKASLAAERAAARAAWHEEHKRDDVAWKARLSGIAADKAVAIERCLRDGGGRSKDFDFIDMAYASIVAAEHRARARARGEPVRVRRRQPSDAVLDAAIPW